MTGILMNLLENVFMSTLIIIAALITIEGIIRKLINYFSPPKIYTNTPHQFQFNKLNKIQFK